MGRVIATTEGEWEGGAGSSSDIVAVVVVLSLLL
jgi:hypothetical protein